ncbi:uncharacterized LOC100382335 isoform 1 [Zea mays]|uniref:Dynein light chain n=1 Tax=Zea mays TaxID=4577 RepID=C0P6N3_MAIZE|nr:uncharacterized LOC100382335 isoform 1 [Zea mays]ACN28649.1 unknown [Zea mays]AQK89594.1 Dynein light chain type 1 family protein [Zea mays]|eukprot:NP_001168554.1 uncharacterized protein LOC100382335 [Zea mays]
MSDEARRGPAGAAQAMLRASSEDRKPVGAGSPAAVAHKIQLKSADMKEEMRQDAFEIARIAFDKHSMEKDIAEYIKKEFDKNHGPTWHCIVGRNFGSYVTHETNYFVYFYIDSKAVLLFKSG